MNEIKNINLKNSDSTEVLLEAVRRGIIDFEDVRYNVEMTKKQEYINAHKEHFKIWQGNNGSWYTYLPDADKPKGRRLVKKKEEETLHQYIYEFYKATDAHNAANISSLYAEWLEYKALHTKSTAYIRRIDVDWNGYYKGTPITLVPLKELDFLTLNKWAHKLIEKYSLTKTQYYNITVIIRQLMQYAVLKGIIEKSCFDTVKIEPKLFVSKKKPNDETQVFLTTEQPEMVLQAFTDFQENCHLSSAPLAIPLLFQIGVRIGELVAIKTTDIQGNYLHIQRMEIKTDKQNSDGSWNPSIRAVVDYTKSEAGDRQIYLTTEARRIIKLIIENNREQGFSDNDFLFLDRRGRINVRAVDARIRKYCRYMGIEKKSCHKVRKTYISTLIDGGVNINEIRKQVGHTDERTTYKNYCFNRLSSFETENALERALCI